ncbi:hypothetical protein GCK32_022481 [Trichostrongylus colubriformis]|uniref:Uncharacterized protein n=1 Tax=Trichostrongylus colubriformis TaxID=6319 RepID=A0AAN8F1E7_TRICO
MRVFLTFSLMSGPTASYCVLSNDFYLFSI